MHPSDEDDRGAPPALEAEARTSLAKVLAVLDVFTEDRLVWAPEALGEALGYPRPTMYRYLKVLREAGLLTSTPGHGYALGPRVVEMDYLMRRSDPLVQAGLPALHAITQACPCTALLVRWYGTRLLCIASDSSDPAAVTSYPRGRPMPLARGAVGRAILAWLPRRRQLPVIEAELETFRALGLGPTPDDVQRALRAVRRTGWAIGHGEVTPGVTGIAAPVFDGASTPVGALAMTVAGTPDTATTARLGAWVAQQAAALSRRIEAAATLPEGEQEC